MLPNRFVVLISLALTQPATAQQQPPQVKVNVLNVCSPSPEEQQQIATTLSHIPKQPAFGSDFEIDRGRSTLEPGPDILRAVGNTQLPASSGTATWVRIRHEFSGQAMFSTVQYSFSQDTKNMVETLVFHVRDPKDVLEVSVEDTASSVTTPATMLSTNTPASRIKLERFGKSSVVLARCSGTEGSPPPDQSAYEPLFQSASAIMASYRSVLGARHMVPEELARLGSPGTSKAKSGAKSAPKKAAQEKPASDNKSP